MKMWKVWTQDSFHRYKVKYHCSGECSPVVDSDGCFDNLCCSHLQSQSELYLVSWWYLTLVVGLTGQLSHGVIGHLSAIKPWCYWLRRLSNVIGVFQPIFLSQSFIVSQINIVGCQSFCHNCQFCLSLSISLLYGAGNCWLQFSGICSKFVNQLSKVSRW